MTLDQLRPNKILRGPLFAEPVQVIITTPMATAVKLVGRGVHSGKGCVWYPSAPWFNAARAERGRARPRSTGRAHAIRESLTAGPMACC